jgi:hypothetical protein
MSKYNLSYDDFMAHLQVFLNDNGKDTYDLEDVDQILRSAGYDPEQTGQEMQAVANQAMSTSPHNWRVRAYRDRERAREEYLQFRCEKTKRTRADLLGEIQSLIAKNNLQVASAYRNLDAQTDEDLEGILLQLEYLEAQRHLSED